MPVKTRIQLRRDTAANWVSAQTTLGSTPILSAGEVGVEVDTNKIKVGNGTDIWGDLPYISGGGGGGETSITISDTAPVSADEGEMWFDSTDATLYVYYNDGVGTLTTRTNLVTNPSFETNITGWVGFLDTPEQSSTYSFVGTKSLKMNPVESGDYVSFFNIPVTAGEVYTVSAYIYTDTSKSVNIAVTGGDSTVTIPAGVWTRISASSTIPEFTTTAAVSITSFSDDTIPFYIDAVMLEQSSTLNQYFDGSTAGASWTGTAHASTSTLSVSSGNSAQWVQVVASSALVDQVGGRVGILETEMDNAQSDITQLETDMLNAKSDINALEDYTIDIDNRKMQSYNHVINGAFDIWQRGTSFTGAVTQYCADRWKIGRTSNVSGYTLSRSTDTPLGFKYSAKLQRNPGDTQINRLDFTTNFETAGIDLAGKTITISFYAKKGANFSGTELAVYTASSSVNPESVTYNSGGAYNSGNDNLGGSTNSVEFTSSWARYSVQATVEPTANALQIRFAWNPSGTGGADDSVYITGVQLEEGPFATPFRRNAPSIQAELAACQRYFYKLGLSYSAYGFKYSLGGGNAFNDSGTYPVEMRASPTPTITGTITYTNCSALAYIVNEQNFTGRVTVTAAGMYRAIGNSVTFSAEL